MVAEQKLRIAFGNLCTNDWIAGCIYLKNLCIALQALDIPLELVVFGDCKDQSQEIVALYVDRFLQIPHEGSRLARIGEKFERRSGISLGFGKSLSDLLRREGVDVVFAN